MVFHLWGDKDFDWAELDNAVRFIARWLERLTIPVYDAKEKWGCARISCSVYLPWHPFIYRMVHRIAIARWPHLRKEILFDTDYPDYLKNL